MGKLRHRLTELIPIKVTQLCRVAPVTEVRLLRASSELRWVRTQEGICLVLSSFGADNITVFATETKQLGPREQVK